MANKPPPNQRDDKEKNRMNDVAKATPGGEQVCPPRHAGWLASSLRRLVHPPETILRELVRPGATVVDIGCGPGFFTLPMARLVGERGRVVAVDLQAAMLERMLYRAARAKLLGRIHAHRCAAGAIGSPGPVDGILAFYMVHEVPDVVGFMRETYAMLRKGGRMLLVEPKFHVTAACYQKTVELAQAAGFHLVATPGIWLSRTALLERG